MRSNVVMKAGASSIFVGVDVHVSSWHVTVRTTEEVFGQATIGGSWAELKKVVSRWRPEQVVILYEAGFSGFHLQGRDRVGSFVTIIISCEASFWIGGPILEVGGDRPVAGRTRSSAVDQRKNVNRYHFIRHQLLIPTKSKL